MRIVSWTVIVGAIAALWFGGVRPMLPRDLLPEMDPARASGTAAPSTRTQRAGSAKSACEPGNADSVAKQPGRSVNESVSCDDSAVAQR